MKRFFLSLTLGLVLGMGAFSLNTSAVAMEETPCWQAAPFLAEHTQNAEAGWDLGEIYSLTWEETKILAYRTSPGTQPEDETYFLKNLEEAGEISGRLRAVILGGYPKVSTETLKDKANAWLKTQARPEIEDLQTGEALLATQITLWKLMDPGSFRESALYGGWKDLTVWSWAGYRSRIQEQEMLSQASTEHTEQNIVSLCAYLESLAPVEGQNRILSDAALAKAAYEAVQQEDGTWCVTVEVPLEEVADTSLTLRALCDGQEQSVPFAEQQTYRFCFENLLSPQAVTVVLEGTQQGNDVYLLSGESTTLLGLAQGPIPVRGEITLSPDRILRIRKATAEGEEGQPLANIQFNLYLVATRDQLQRGEVSLGAEPTAQEVESCQSPENLVAILSTDENGQASYNFTAGGNPDGVYLVVEQFCAGTTGPVDPFYITIPSEEGYIQELRLENDLETQPELTLSVTQRGRTEDTFGVGQNQTWYIWGSIPAGMSAAKTYTLWDLLPQGVDYGESSALVTLETRAGESLHLVRDIHYTMTLEEGELEIALTPAGMAYVAANRGEGPQEPGILVAFEAILNENAPLGQPISHRARLSYINGAGISYSKTSPWACVWTGGFSIRKTNPSGTPLAGNTYRLARAAGEGEKTSEKLNVAGKELPVIYVSFLTEGGIQEETATDEAGWASFSGIPYGNYYLVETQGTGEAPVEIVVDGQSHRTSENPLEDRTVRLVSTRLLLPDTGGIGAVVLTAAGAVSMICACWLLLLNRRRTP